MKKVLITGADGFIGSHLVEEMLIRGYQVRAFCLYNSFNSYGWLDDTDVHLKRNIDFHVGDIRDAQTVKKAVKGCDIIIHLAALISIPYSYQAPDSFIKTNIQGTLNILQTALEYETEKVLVTSTSEVYGTAQSVPITENHPIMPQSPYAASKVGADALAMSYFKSYGLNITIARPFNTYGPRQSLRAVIPTMITQLLQKTKEIKLGNLVPTRDFLYIKDTVNGLLSIIEKDGIAGTTFNISSGKEISIGTLADLLIAKISPDTVIKENKERIRPKESEVLRLIGDASHLKKITGWEPEFSLENGLQHTIEWFSIPENINKYKTNIYTI